MTAARDDRPRLLTSQEAAFYCNLNVAVLRAHGPAPLVFGKLHRWDRKVLDAWLDGLSGITAPVGAGMGEIDDEPFLAAIRRMKR